jgi:hypothetical protein
MNHVARNELGDGTSCAVPPRSTVAFTEIMALSLAAALVALDSWNQLQSPTLRAIMDAIMTAAGRISGRERDGREHAQQDYERVEHRAPE